jgi:hypothetical protein
MLNVPSPQVIYACCGGIIAFSPPRKTRQPQRCVSCTFTIRSRPYNWRQLDRLLPLASQNFLWAAIRKPIADGRVLIVQSCGAWSCFSAYDHLCTSSACDSMRFCHLSRSPSCAYQRTFLLKSPSIVVERSMKVLLTISLRDQRP